jgi:hypothetical protein
MIKDLRQGKVADVIDNRNMNSGSFNQKVYHGLYGRYHLPLWRMYLLVCLVQLLIEVLISLYLCSMPRMSPQWLSVCIVRFTTLFSDDLLQMYIERMIKDWSQGEVANVFCNRNMESPLYREIFLIHLNEIELSIQHELSYSAGRKQHVIQERGLIRFLDSSTTGRWRNMTFTISIWPFWQAAWRGDSPQLSHFAISSLWFNSHNKMDVHHSIKHVGMVT